MYNLFSINQVNRLLYLSQHSLNIIVPITKHTFSIPIFLLESDLPGQAIDLGLDSLVNYHVADFCFSSILWDTDQSRQRLYLYLTVILLNHTKIVLDQLSEEFAHVGPVVFSAFSKWLVCRHFLLDSGFIQRHELIGEELVDVACKIIVFLQVSGVEGF